MVIMANIHYTAKRIAVCDKSGHTIAVLKDILALCGHSGFEVLPAEEPIGQDVQPLVLLFCDAEKIVDAPRFSTCVTDYELAARPELDGLHPLTYSITSNNADFTARNIRRTQDGFAAFEIVGVGIIGRVKLAAGCEQSVSTALAAAAACIACGIPFAEVLEALNHIKIED
jgi:hypothetical protein